MYTLSSAIRVLCASTPQLTISLNACHMYLHLAVYVAFRTCLYDYNLCGYIQFAMRACCLHPATLTTD